MGKAEDGKLKAGDEHYTAFVGPPHQYDFMGATQFRLLCELGLRDHHHVLDFGCGSLRAGRLLITYLQPDRYFGIEPNRWLIDEAIAKEIGQDMVRIKRPRFSHSDAFTASVFDETFDFIVAQSIFSHAGPTIVRRALASFAERLKPGGICAVTFVVGGKAAPTPGEGWLYPACVRYRREAIRDFVEDAGLLGMPIPWFHPRQVWFLLALNRESLPTAREARLLHGAVLRAPEFRSSVTNLTDRKTQRGPSPPAPTQRR